MRTLNALRPFAVKGVPIIGLEPSCLFTLRDEFLVIAEGESRRCALIDATADIEGVAQQIWTEVSGRLGLA